MLFDLIDLSYSLPANIGERGVPNQIELYTN